MFQVRVRLGAIAEILAAAIHEEIDRRAINKLKAAVGDIFPVIRRDAFTHNAAGDGHELQIQIFDTQFVDAAPYLFDQIAATSSLYEALIIRH
jgi:hypothetical protein